MSDVQGFVEGISKCSPSELVGKDELGMTAVLSNFKPVPTERLQEILKGMLGFGSEAKVPGAFVRIDADVYVTLLNSAVANACFAVYVEEGDEKTFFSHREGKEITFRPKTVRYYQHLGSGEAGVEEGLALLGELREAIELVAMRALGGVARYDSDAGDDVDDFDLEEEVDELRALMEE